MALRLFVTKRKTARPPAFPRRGSAAGWAAVLASAVLLSGCAGYQVGNWSLYPHDVRTVHVPMFDSTSFRRNLGERLTEAVIKEIEEKTPYKVVSRDKADSALTGRIVGEGKRVVVENPYDDPRQLDVDLQVEVCWTDRHGTMIRETATLPLPPELTMVHGTATLVPEVGQSVTTSQQQAIERMAEQIVGMMETPW